MNTGYIKKAQVGGLDIAAKPVVVKEGPAFAIMDAQDSMGMVPSYKAMDLACEKARETGIGVVTVKTAPILVQLVTMPTWQLSADMLGLSMSNVDPNMTAPGARGTVICYNLVFMQRQPA